MRKWEPHCSIVAQCLQLKTCSCDNFFNFVIIVPGIGQGQCILLRHEIMFACMLATDCGTRSLTRKWITLVSSRRPSTTPCCLWMISTWHSLAWGYAVLFTKAGDHPPLIGGMMANSSPERRIAVELSEMYSILRARTQVCMQLVRLTCFLRTMVTRSAALEPALNSSFME